MTRLIAFDVDSTLLTVESLDFAILAAGGNGAQARIEAITQAGMSGSMSLRASLTARLDQARLTRSDIARAAVALKDTITPGMAGLIAALRRQGDQVAAISGGFDALLRLALRDLGFEPALCRTNSFTWEGEAVAGFDASNPLSDNGGKAIVLNELALAAGARETVMVGDGITDLETLDAGAAHRFIGFGGVVRREAVAARAPEYADCVDELSRLLLR